MKILKAKFKNMIGIEEGLGMDELNLDFTNQKNKIIMIKGANGSGKSTIISLLHPLLETFDKRLGYPNIKDKVGEKELLIEHNDSLYNCRIIYDPRKTKCFFTKDGDELNPNGNVTSYIELVKEHLGLEREFFKTAKLGSNVVNFIDLPRAKRKEYINQFIPNIDEYLEAGSIVNKKFLSLQDNIGYLGKQLNKYPEENVLEERVRLAEVPIDEKQKMLSKYNLEYMKVKDELETVKSEIEEKYSVEFIEDMKTLQNEYTILNEQFITHPDFKYIEEKIPDPKKRNEEYQIELTELSVNLKNLNKEILTASGDRSKYSKELKETETLISQVDIKSIDSLKDFKVENEEHLETLKTKHDSITFKGYEKFSNVDIKEIRSTAGLQQRLISSAIELKNYYDDDKRKEVLSKYPNVSFVKNVLKKQQEVLNTLKEKEKTIRKQLATLESNLPMMEILEQRPKECYIDDCPFIKNALIHKNVEKDMAAKDKELQQIVEKVKLEETILEDLQTIPNFLNAFNNFTSSILENNLIKLFTGINNITNVRKCLNESNLEISKLFDIMGSELKNKLEYKALIDELETKIKSNDAQIALLEKEKAIIDIHQKKYDTLKGEIKSLDEKINTLTTDRDHLETKISTLKSKIETIITYLEKLAERDALATEVKLNEEKFATYQFLLKKQETLTSTLTPLENSINKCKTELKKLDDTKIAIQTDLINRRNFTKLLEEVSEKYDFYKIVKEALDVKVGIPLIFSKNFLEIIEEETNHLLNIAYKGDFQIHFVVTEKEFLINVDKQGRICEDISDVSQGQESLTKIALSLSINKMGIDQYNIVYLDELDAFLDEDNRALFIEILETQLEELDCEQCFVISHNDVFDASPIDLILLRGAENFVTNSNQNIIFSCNGM